MRATVPSTKPKHLRRGAPFQTTTSAYLYKYGGCNKLNSMNLVCDGDVDQ